MRVPFANWPKCTLLSVQKWRSHWSQMFSKCVLAWQTYISREFITESPKNHTAQWYAHLRTIRNLFESKSSQKWNHFGSDECCNGKHDFSWIHSKIQTIITRRNGTDISDKCEPILRPKVSQKCPKNEPIWGHLFLNSHWNWLTSGRNLNLSFPRLFFSQIISNLKIRLHFL